MRVITSDNLAMRLKLVPGASVLDNCGDALLLAPEFCKTFVVDPLGCLVAVEDLLPRQAKASSGAAALETVE